MEYRGRLWEKYIFVPENDEIIFQSKAGSGHASDMAQHLANMSKLLMITNVTQNEIIYSPQIPGKGYVTANFPYLKLEYDCSSMDKDDILQIFVEVDYVDIESIRNQDEARKQQTQVGILKTLLKLEKHLELMTDEVITEEDIGGPGLKRK
jgi:hypothetical protein